MGGIGITLTFAASRSSSGGNCAARKEGRYFANDNGVGGTIQYVQKMILGSLVLLAIKIACPFGACGLPRKNRISIIKSVARVPLALAMGRKRHDPFHLVLIAVCTMQTTHIFRVNIDLADTERWTTRWTVKCRMPTGIVQGHEPASFAMRIPTKIAIPLAETPIRLSLITAASADAGARRRTGKAETRRSTRPKAASPKRSGFPTRDTLV